MIFSFSKKDFITQHFYKNVNHALLPKGHVTIFILLLKDMWQYSFILHVCVLKFNLIQFMSGQVLNEGVYNENYKKTHDIEKFLNSLAWLF